MVLMAVVRVAAAMAEVARVAARAAEMTVEMEAAAVVLKVACSSGGGGLFLMGGLFLRRGKGFSLGWVGGCVCFRKEKLTGGEGGGCGCGDGAEDGG